jgi:hypothetical protein
MGSDVSSQEAIDELHYSQLMAYGVADAQFWNMCSYNAQSLTTSEAATCHCIIAHNSKSFENRIAPYSSVNLARAVYPVEGRNSKQHEFPVDSG